MTAFQKSILSHDDARPSLSHASRVILIDNYDSFTYNVSQYLALEGANVEVVRNDAITLEELIAKNPTQLVVSPGPGHPESDSGISKEAIKHFTGKIPILGVCMGQQCIFTVYGGTVGSANEILHGKTSDVLHDGIGIFEGIEQSIPVTRYHSLAGTADTVPDCLNVTSWTADKGIIMGVRHKEFVMEGMQFHPESILSLTGRKLFRNFLRWRHGTWKEEDSRLSGSIVESTAYKDWRNSSGVPLNKQSTTVSSKPSKLEEIYERRRQLVEAQKSIPGQRQCDLDSMYDLSVAPPQIDFKQRIMQSPFRLALMAEIKRGSPSKGIIDISVSSAVQARRYAVAGAAVISVLTEPDWFKGSIEDLRAARAAVDGMTHRPAILRKEFIFDEYQILEARLNGADTVLLIVKMLPRGLLEKLYKYSKTLGMEPLVEVNDEAEMRIAVDIGAQVIGVNNRDLHSFNVDLGTTTSLVKLVPDGTILCALSGISERKDVEIYEQQGVKGVLVGEALMRSGSELDQFVTTLMGSSEPERQENELLVKICGTRTPKAAKAAVEAGADLVGIILVQGSKRCVDLETALQISEAVHKTAKIPVSIGADENIQHDKPNVVEQNFFEHHLSTTLRNPKRSLLVGVFQNQPLEYILHLQKILDLDVVQLHGNEPLEYSRLIPVPVIKSFHPSDQGIGRYGYHSAPLLDSGVGGTGESLPDLNVKKVLSNGTPIILAGGLNPNNVLQVLERLGGKKAGIRGVDVSSGVESEGQQDLQKIADFVKKAKTYGLSQHT